MTDARKPLTLRRCTVMGAGLAACVVPARLLARSAARIETPYQFAIAGRLASMGWERGRNLRSEVYVAGHAFAQTAVQMDAMLAWLLA